MGTQWGWGGSRSPPAPSAGPDTDPGLRRPPSRSRHRPGCSEPRTYPRPRTHLAGGPTAQAVSNPSKCLGKVTDYAGAARGLPGRRKERPRRLGGALRGRAYAPQLPQRPPGRRRHGGPPGGARLGERDVGMCCYTVTNLADLSGTWNFQCCNRRSPGQSGQADPPDKRGLYLEKLTLLSLCFLFVCFLPFIFVLTFLLSIILRIDSLHSNSTQ